MRLIATLLLALVGFAAAFNQQETLTLAEAEQDLLVNTFIGKLMLIAESSAVELDEIDFKSLIAQNMMDSLSSYRNHEKREERDSEEKPKRKDDESGKHANKTREEGEKKHSKNKTEEPEKKRDSQNRTKGHEGRNKTSSDESSEVREN